MMRSTATLRRGSDVSVTAALRPLRGVLGHRGDAHREGAGLDLDVHALCVVDEVSVELSRLRPAGLDDDVLAAEPFHALVGNVLATQHATGEPGPVEGIPWRENGDVEDSVIGLGVGQQQEAPLQLADVSHEHRAHVPFDGLALVDGDADADPAAPHVFGTGHEIGRPANGLLQLLGGVTHDGGVEAETRHDDEPPALDGADVDVPGRSVDTDAQRGCLVIEREIEVAGKQVPGAERHDGHRHFRPRERRRAGHDSAVAATDEHESAALLDRLLAHADARIVRGRLQPERRLPAGGRHERLGALPERARVADLRRVDDERRPAHLAPAVTGAGACEGSSCSPHPRRLSTNRLAMATQARPLRNADRTSVGWCIPR